MIRRNHSVMYSKGLALGIRSLFPKWVRSASFASLVLGSMNLGHVLEGSSYKKYQYRAEMIPFQQTLKVMYSHLDMWQGVLEEEGISEDDGLDAVEQSLDQIAALIDVLPDTEVGWKYLFFVTPLKIDGNDHFMTLVHSPQPDTAFTLGQGHWFVGITQSLSKQSHNSKPEFYNGGRFIDVHDVEELTSSFETLPKKYYHYQNGSVLQTSLNFGYGINDKLDIEVEGGWLTFTDYILYDFAEFENYSLRGEVKQSLDDLIVSLKYRLKEFNNHNSQVSIKGEYKEPLGDPELMVTSGVRDVSMTALMSHKVKEKLFLNANFGYTKIGDLKENFAYPIDQKSGIMHWNVGGTLKINKFFGLGGGYSFVESPFKNFRGADYLTEPVTKTNVGAKLKFWNVMAEASFIKGVSKGSSESAGSVSVYFVTK